MTHSSILVNNLLYCYEKMNCVMVFQEYFPRNVLSCTLMLPIKGFVVLSEVLLDDKTSLRINIQSLH